MNIAIAVIAYAAVVWLFLKFFKFVSESDRAMERMENEFTNKQQEERHA